MILHYLHSGVQAERLLVSENNSSSTFVELLRGRDGLPGRDGVRGPPGSHGPQGKEGPAGPKNGGVTYIRWGNSTCPNGTGREEVYSGITAGTEYTQSGGGANHLCLPKVPEYNLPYNTKNVVVTYLHGTQYENVFNGKHDHNAPCAVCYVSTRSTIIMIPAKSSCPPSWTREYYGYLMAEYSSHKRSMYECVEKDMESIPGSSSDVTGALFYHTKAGCNVGIPCPPYDNLKELSCVVCTK